MRRQSGPAIMPTRKGPPRLSPSDLRALRSKVSKLKKLGGISKRVDARKQRPTRYMIRKVKSLEPVLQGRAVLIPKKKIRSDLLSDYQRTSMSVNRRLMIPKQPNETVRIRRGLPELEREIAKTGERRVVQRRVPLPVNIENLEDFASDLMNRPERWAAARGKYPPWVFGFTIFGNRSTQLFESPEALAQHLQKYIDAMSEDDLEEAWNEFVLYAIDVEDFGRWYEGAPRRRGGRGRNRRRAGYKAADHAKAERERRAKMNEAERQRERVKNAAAHRVRRAALNAKGLTQHGTKPVKKK